MRKTGFIKTAIVLLIVAGLLVALTACGGRLSGEYKSSGLIPQTLTFDGDKVTMSAFGINATATYEIKDGKISFTYSLLGLEQTLSQTFSRNGSSIIIGGTEFVKQK